MEMEMDKNTAPVTDWKYGIDGLQPILNWIRAAPKYMGMRFATFRLGASFVDRK